MLENGNLTTRHRRFMTKGIPEKVVDEAVGLDPVIHEGADITESGHSELGVVTRSKRRMYANTARGNFQGKSRQSSKVTHHSHWEDTGEMGGPCCALPMMFMGIYALMTTLVIAVLSIFLHQCSRSSSHTGVSEVTGVS